MTEKKKNQATERQLDVLTYL